MFDMDNLKKMMDQANEMQSQMKDRLAQMAITGSAAGGAVSVVINGNKEVTKLDIQPEVMRDHEMLADMILSALSSAYAEADRQVPNQMTGGISDMLQNVDLSGIADMFRK